MTNHTPNPYTTMLLTSDPARFYGRDAEIISILQLVTARDPSGHAIYGMRTMGKTTMLRYLMAPGGATHRYENYMNPDFVPGGGRRLFFVYANFHLHQATDDVFSLLLQRLIEQIEPDPWSGQIDLPDYQAGTPRGQVISHLRRIVHDMADMGGRVVFLMDDFDEPLRFIDEDVDRLLRALSDAAPLILVTEAPISEIRPDIGDSSPLIGVLRPEALGLLGQDAARQLVAEPAMLAGLRFSDKEQAMLLSIAGRQPFLLLTACEHYFDLRREYPDIAVRADDPATHVSLRDQITQRLMALPHVIDLLGRFWGALQQREQAVLLQLVRDGHVNGDEADAGYIGSRLAMKALVYDDLMSGVYRPFSLLFERYLRGKMMRSRRSSSPQTSENPAIISRLTPLDANVYRYLRQHIGEVCSFNQLLDAIWPDSEKSKRALEAAVHRIRRALPPNEEIKNVRGKGYKLIVDAQV